MAQKRSSQRGVVRMASGLLLAAFGAMLSLTGCSSGEQDENLGQISQGICLIGSFCCGITTCENLGPCVDVSCDQNIKNTCVYTDLPDGNGCKGANGEGVCMAPDARTRPICCTGCVGKGPNGPICQKGTQIAACGIMGLDCKSCDTGNSCVDSCQNGQCIEEKAADGEACREAPGFCSGAACCTGCIDGNGACKPGNTTASCGNSVASGGIVNCAVCNDGKVCTADACNAQGKCVAPNETDGKACPNATKCDGDESCKGGACQPVANFMCPVDMNACHAPSCDPVAGCSQKNLTGTNCPDANLCNGVEKCNNGVCNVPGTPKNCNDNKPCTIDSCDPQSGACTNTPVTAGELCENGNVCDGIGVCNNVGVCQVQPAEPCLAERQNDPCNVYACDKTKGCIVASFTILPCNDGDPCTTADKCSAGNCVGGPQQKCDDGNVCTADSCVKGQGCTAVPANEGNTCDDGNNCSTGDKCVAGTCKSSGGKTCNPDTNPCTTATCEPASNECGNSNDNTLKCQVDKCHQITQCANGGCPLGAAAIDCTDTNPCTKDGCDPLTGCTNVPDDTAKCPDDGDLCTEGDSCKAGKCVTAPVTCEPVSDCHLPGDCNPNSGHCDAPRAPAGKSCNDHTGTCDSNGKCIPNPAGEGGAGGAGGVGAGGDGTSGSATQGGEPPVVGTAGDGNEPAVGGETATPSGGKGNTTNGGSANNEGGAPEVPDRVFVRDPGGCSCNVPSSQPSNLAWLGGLALVGALARRRRARQTGPAAGGPRLS